MGKFRQLVLAAVPTRLRANLRTSWQKCLARKSRILDSLQFPVWLAFQCARHRKQAVLIGRCTALGDVICTLPMCSEVRKRHPGKLIIFVTGADYRDMVLLSGAPDLVFGYRYHKGQTSTIAADFNLMGLVAAVYIPRTMDENSPSAGAQCHLIDDLAGSCGLTVHARQPRLHPSPALIQRTLDEFRLAGDLAKNRLIVGINGGRTWPVRMWDAAKWQVVVDKIHAEFDAVVLQFGYTRNDGSDEFDNLSGVRSLANRLKSLELVALTKICHLIISIDSGPVHLAGAVGTPVIGLFGAVNPSYRLPPESPAVGLYSEAPCRFCHHTTPRGHWQSDCQNGIACMKELDVDTVFKAVESLVADTFQSARRCQT
jgi:ADP-heptose:LPS heptosyltransferase